MVDRQSKAPADEAGAGSETMAAIVDKNSLSQNAAEVKQSVFLRAALAYAAEGFFVFPMRPNCKRGYFSKRDVGATVDGELKGGFYAGTRDPEQIRAWWTRWPRANIGVDCERSGIIVLDADVKDGDDGIGAYKDLCRETSTTEDTWTVETPTGGQHAFYAANGQVVGTRAGVLPGLDVRASGGLVILPPSRTPRGDYHFALNFGPRDLPMAPCPPALAARLGPPRPKRAPFLGGSPVPDDVLDIYRGADGWDSGAEVWGYCPWCPNESLLGESSLNRETGAFHCFGCEASSGWKGLAIKLGIRSDSQGKSATTPTPGAFRLDDIDNARRLAKRHGAHIRFVKEWGWLVWDGRRWARDRGQVRELAKETARSIYAEAAACDDTEIAKAVGKWARLSGAKARVDAMISMADSLPEITADPGNFDADPYLFNAHNGIVDLRTGQLRPHDPAAMFTKLGGCDYDATAECPVWQTFLDRIMGRNAALIDFNQRALGHSLTGDTSEQAFYVGVGVGANGKTTYMGAVRDVLGEYGRQADFSTFLERRSDAIRNDLAALAGVRFVCAIEANQGQKLAENVIKQLTGGDSVVARFLHKEYFEFAPLFKVWLLANHRPVIQGTDHAMWRRVRMIPFDVVIEEAERDKHLGAKLRGELPGILAWMVRGCLAWQRQGLDAPEAVQNATAGYRAEMDVLGGFLDECCILGGTMQTKASELHNSYRDWCKANSEKAISGREMATRLAERGFEKRRRADGVYYLGIGLFA